MPLSCPPSDRVWPRALLTLALLWGGTAWAEPLPASAAAQAMRGLYGGYLPQQAQAFSQQAHTLARQLPLLCQGQTSAARTQAQWQRTLQAWSELATPATGPVLTRRTPRQIDFWPARPELIQKAIAKAPATLADLDTVGTPAKGLPALELLLHQAGPKHPLSPAHCSYATLLAQDVAQEAVLLQQAYDELARQDWDSPPDLASNALAEWGNQWLAGLEKLRWAHIEKPVRAANGKAPVFARLTPESNLLEWQAQWHSLLAQARLSPAPRQPASSGAPTLIPIESLLLGQGHSALAQRWHLSLAQADAALSRLGPDAPTPALLAASQALKNVSALFQNEVAPALGIAIGFSDADGD